MLAQTDTTALHTAAGNGHVAATRALLESGVAIDKPNSRRQTALHVAAESGHTAVIEALIEHGAHHFCDINYETPIHLAAKADQINVLEFHRRTSLTNSNSFNTICLTIELFRYDSRRTVLHSAAAGCHECVIRWLVENGADVNATDRNDDSPLIVATRHGNETAVRVLLELGATVGGEVAGKLGIDPHINILVQAANSLNISIIRMLLESVEKINKHIVLEVNVD